MFELSPRQIHLDFHTSENIGGIGADFDPQEFARTAKDASVSSMTVFARCHHGWLYYDSQRFPDTVHPHLARRNLLLEQVRALHAEGIKAPVYITVQWDYHAATTHPEWLIRRADGSHEGSPFTEPGFYQSLCVNTGYYDYLEGITGEVMDILGDELDGLFFDIVGIRPCLCASCRAEMKQRGIDAADAGAVQAFAKFTIDRFKRRMTEFVRARNANCSIFYNAGHIGPCTRDSEDAYTHFELESLPSGSWGYLHFPVTARYARKLGKDCMGMTGKFHTSWADFHSLKNQAALEFEAFRMLSYGFACSIGDQLEPCGRINKATYRLIGKVYGPFAAREQWARPSVPLTEVALMTPETDMYEHRMPESVMGATQLLEELAVQFDILDSSMSLDGYKLAILPDDFTIDEAFADKLSAFVAAGGKVIACGRGGTLPNGTYPACFGAKPLGENELYPDFIVPEGALTAGLDEDAEYVIYMQGMRIAPEGGKAAMWARAPYFARKGDKFCSHLYTPSAHGDKYPCAVINGGVLTFGHPLMEQYRRNAPAWVKAIVRNAIDMLLPDRLVRHDGPSTVTVSLLDQPDKERTCAHVLTYIPVRKSATIDIVEERTVVNDVTLTLNIPRKFTRARLVPEDIALTVEDGKVRIPRIDGYAIVELS